MSKLAEKLQRVYRGSAPSMGFRKSAEADIPPLLVVASLSKTSPADAGALAAAGIDAGILGVKGLGAKSYAQLAEAVNYIPLGISLESTEKDVIAKSIGIGCDFVVFGLKTPLEAVDKEDLGRVLRIESSLEPGLVRAINGLSLSIDAVLVDGEEPAITIERLLIYQRFTDLVDKPLLVTLSSMITEKELGGLFEAGVNGLVLPEGLTAESLADLKKSISRLSRATRRKPKTAAILPRLGGELETGVEEEEEEDI
ncbi:MAG: hypothetical protein JSV54_09300 [Chloroflexota bacterium]|nr:MAG: hypothetical protein JSV54_09300 [Chloroflexota bacterium]